VIHNFESVDVLVVLLIIKKVTRNVKHFQVDAWVSMCGLLFNVASAFSMCIGIQRCTSPCQTKRSQMPRKMHVMHRSTLNPTKELKSYFQ